MRLRRRERAIVGTVGLDEPDAKHDFDVRSKALDNAWRVTNEHDPADLSAEELTRKARVVERFLRGDSG